jgi:hypothetical protein
MTKKPKHEKLRRRAMLVFCCAAGVSALRAEGKQE